MKVPLRFDWEAIKAYLVQQLTEPTTKRKVLIVDDEIYGPVEFPVSYTLGRGQLLRFPGYGQV